MKKPFVFKIAAILCLLSQPALAAGEGPAGINWIYGPVTAKVGEVARIFIPAGYACANDRENIKKVVEYIGTIYHPNEIFILSSIDLESKNSRWMSFYYDPVGFVREEAPGELDVEGILESGTESTERDNKERKAKGYWTGQINGWAVKPHYGKATHYLEWAYDCSWYDPKGVQVNETVNYYAKYLGQHGVMSIQLSTGKGMFKKVYPEFKKILKTFKFNRENSYMPETVKPGEITGLTFNDLIVPVSEKRKTNMHKKPAPAEPPDVSMPVTAEKTAGTGWKMVSLVLLLLLLASWILIILLTRRLKKSRRLLTGRKEKGVT